MAEYIDRGKLVEFLKQVRRDLTYDSEDFFTRDEMILNFQQFVESKSFVPSEDVEPVRRGHWIINSDGYYPQCSECMKEPQGRVMTDWCPNCGARMKGEKNGK